MLRFLCFSQFKIKTKITFKEKQRIKNTTQLKAQNNYLFNDFHFLLIKQQQNASGFIKPEVDFRQKLKHMLRISISLFILCVCTF